MNWKYIMIHHSLTRDGKVVDWNAIRRYHVKVRGWRDIGYHWGVERVGESYVVQKGRPMNTPGAHCREGHMNFKAIGVCFVGNYDLEPPPYPMLVFGIANLIIPLMRNFGIPVENIVAHRDYAHYKSCPGKMFDMDEFRDMVRRML